MSRLRRKNLLTALCIIVITASAPVQSLASSDRVIGAGYIDGIIASADLTPYDRDMLKAAYDRAVRSGIPAEDAGIIISRGLSNKAAPLQIETLISVPVAIQEKGMSSRAVLERIQQGLAKGVRPHDIVTSANRLASLIIEAGRIMERLDAEGVRFGADLHDRATEALARAMEMNVPADVLISAGSAVRSRTDGPYIYLRGIETIAVFASAGMKPSLAGKLVQAGLEKGYKESDFARMERDMVSGLRNGRSIDKIASDMESAVIRGEAGSGYRGPDTRLQRESGPSMRGGSGLGGGQDRRR